MVSPFGRRAGGKAHARPDAEPRLGGGCEPRGRAGRALGSELVIEGVQGGGGRRGGLGHFGGSEGFEGAARATGRLGWALGARGAVRASRSRVRGMLCRPGGINFSDVGLAFWAKF